MKAPIVTVTARTGAEPALRFLNDGTAICSVRAVWSQDRPDGTGGWVQEHTTWLSIEWWGRAGEHTGDLGIGSGDLIRVTGALYMESFTRRDGSPGEALKLRADGTPKHWPKRDGGESAGTAPRPETSAAAAASGAGARGAALTNEGGTGDPPF